MGGGAPSSGDISRHTNGGARPVSTDHICEAYSLIFMFKYSNSLATYRICLQQYLDSI